MQMKRGGPGGVDGEDVVVVVMFGGLQGWTRRFDLGLWTHLSLDDDWISLTPMASTRHARPGFEESKARSEATRPSRSHKS